MVQILIRKQTTAGHTFVSDGQLIRKAALYKYIKLESHDKSLYTKNCSERNKITVHICINIVFKLK